MAAFDVTTKPTSLTLKPGSTGTIMVVVSNRLGRPVMGFVEGVITPGSAAGWVMPPPDVQRPYPADPSATVTHEFKIAVPENAPAQVAHFKASARDVLAPDDTRSDGQTVAINITRDAPVPVPPRPRWWLWVILAVVVLAGAGVAIWLWLKPDKKLVPSVLRKPPAEATTILMEAGFDSVIVRDTVGGPDTNRVIRQDPEAQSEMPKAKEDEKLVATIVVNQLMPGVPSIVGKKVEEARITLTQAGFWPVNIKDTLKSETAADTHMVVRQDPLAGSELPKDSLAGKTPATIVVSRPAGRVPELNGLKVTTAAVELGAAGLRVGAQIKKFTGIQSRDGKVANSQPEAGTLLPRGSPVNLVVYQHIGF